MRTVSRTILYYPEIEVPTHGAWIRRALLYWDHVAAIVPESYHNPASKAPRFRPQLAELEKEGIFRPLAPSILLESTEHRREFYFEFKSIHEQFLKQRRESNLRSIPIFVEKFNSMMLMALRQKGLAVPDDVLSSIQGIANPNKRILVEATTAGTYMALFAKHLAAMQKDPTIPATDKIEDIQAAFPKYTGGKMTQLLSANLEGIIPVPQPSVSLKKILKFRKDYRSELLNFRTALDKFEAALAKAGDKQEIGALTLAFKDTIEKEGLELEKMFASSKLSTFLGSLQSFVTSTASVPVVASSVVIGTAATIATAPISVVVAGVVATGSLGVAAHLVSKDKEKKAERSTRPHAYLFLADRELK